jgi:hypothetical protein
MDQARKKGIETKKPSKHQRTSAKQQDPRLILDQISKFRKITGNSDLQNFVDEVNNAIIRQNVRELCSKNTQNTHIRLK